MTATFTHTDRYYLPAIAHKTGRIEVLAGPPHATIKTAIKYAQIEIAERYWKSAK